MVQVTDFGVAQPGSLKRRSIELENARVGMDGSAALVLPAAGDGGDRKRRMQVHRAVALARKAVSEPEERSLRGSHQPGEILDFLNGQTGDGGRPGRRPVLKVPFQPF